LAWGAMALSQHSHLAAAELRLRIHSAVSLIARFAIASPEELQFLSGKEGVACDEYIEAFVTRTCSRLVFGPC
jgi:hypothetical protein